MQLLDMTEKIGHDEKVDRLVAQMHVAENKRLFQIEDFSQELLTTLQQLELPFAISEQQLFLYVSYPQIDVLAKRVAAEDGQPFETVLAQERVIWQVGKHQFDFNQRGIVYGVLNVSPESFFDGEKVSSVQLSIDRGIQQLDDGADVIEVGGQTTKPGFEAQGLELEAAEEIDRILPVIDGILKLRPEAVIAVDTYKVKVMQAAIEHGVSIINDVNGFETAEKRELLAKSQVGLLTMFNGRDIAIEKLSVTLDDFFTDNMAELEAAGIDRQRIALDPGIGYSGKKDGQHDLAMMNKVGNLEHFERPVMTAVSDKGWAKHLLDLPKDERADASLIAAVIMYQRGGKILRVHDVKSAYQAIRIVETIDRAY